jgi:filamentous hemagglutinin
VVIGASGTGASLAVTGPTFVGGAGTGTVLQQGGTLTTARVIVGGITGGSGTYSLSAGTVSASSDIIVGAFNNSGSHTGNFNQSGGFVTTPTVIVGNCGPVSGGSSYQLSGTGSISTSSLSVYSFSGAPGLFDQSGGTLSATGSIMVGGDVISQPFDFQGVYNLHGGTASTPQLNVGNFGDGTVTHSAGTANIGTLGLRLGVASTADTGFYRLSGTGSLSVSGNVNVGFFGNGTFVQNGGTASITGTVFLGLDSGAKGSYDLTGNNLTAGSINISRNGSLTFSAGVMAPSNIINNGFMFAGPGFTTSAFTIGVAASTTLNGNVTINNVMTDAGAPVAGTGTISIAAPATFSGSGQIAPSVSNAGTVNASGGNLTLNSANFANTGTLKASSAANLFINTTNVTHTGDIIVGAGGAVVFNNASITNNSGHGITMSGGILAALSITNASGGTFSSFGQVSGDVSNSGSMIFNGPSQLVGNLTNNIGGQILVKNDKLLVLGAGTNNGAITTSNGTIVFDGGLTGTPPGGAALSVGASGGALASFYRGQAVALNGTASQLATMTVRAGAFGGDTSVLPSLTIAGSADNWFGRVDLADDDLIIDYDATSPIATVTNQIKTGFANGAWTGNGISSNSAAAAAASAHRTGLGYAESSSIFNTFPNTFSGQSVDSTAVLIRYTLAGDGNLDGAVDLTDFTFLAANFNGTGKNWLQGDYNYDGSVDLTDFTFLAANFNQSLPAGIGAVVPEPTHLAVCALATTMLRRRRR